MTSPGPQPRRLGKVPALDGLRGIAIVLVICLHTGLVAGGYIGVDVFMALSGFLITALLYGERDATGSVALGAFFMRRVRRLLPALLLLVGLFTVVMLALHPWATRWPIGRVDAGTLLFINNFVCTFSQLRGTAIGALDPTWTLAQEMQFYLIWPPILVLLLSLRCRPRTVLAVIGTMIAALLVAEPIVHHAVTAYNTYTTPLNRSCELLFGSAAAILWRERLLSRLLYSWPAPWLLAGAITFMVIHFPLATPHTYLGAAALSALLIISLLGEPGTAAERRPIMRLLSLRPVAFTGRISYGIYLFHVPAYYLIWTYVPHQSRYVYAAATLLASWSMACASWMLIERPLMRMRVRMPNLVVRRSPRLARLLSDA